MFARHSQLRSGFERGGPATPWFTIWTFTLLMGSVLAPAAAAAPLYRVTVLGEPPYPFDVGSGARGINNAGEVVGASFRTAVLWTGTDAVQDLGSLQSGDTSSANAINNAGQVVGKSNFSNEQAFLWTSTGGMQYLGDLPNGTPTREAHDVNDAGQVVGDTNVSDSGRAFLWTESGGAEDLGELPRTGQYGTQAYGINDTGEVVGHSKGRAFLWTRSSGMQDLGVLPGDDTSIAYGINNLGHVVGISSTFGVNGERPFLWTSSGGMQELVGLPDEHKFAIATMSINDAGQVVGIASGINVDIFQAFRWTSSGGMQDLNTLLDPSGDGWLVEEASGINNAGQIAATGRVVGDRFFTHALLLTPVPEPATLVLCVMGMSAIRLLRARPRLNDRKHVTLA